MPVTNRDRFPDVDFLESDQIKIVGKVGEINLALIGEERGSNAPVVSRAYTDEPKSEDLFAVPLYELMSHSQDQVVIDQL